VVAALPGVSVRRVCRVLIFLRSGLRARSLKARPVARLDQLLAERIARLIVAHPTFGYRRLWALLRFGEGVRVNRKAAYRVLRLKGWFVHQRSVTPRPRVQGRISRAQRSNQRWAMET
jgi:putative transposase